MSVTVAQVRTSMLSVRNSTLPSHLYRGCLRLSVLGDDPVLLPAPGMVIAERDGIGSAVAKLSLLRLRARMYSKLLLGVVSSPYSGISIRESISLLLAQLERTQRW